MQVAYLSEEGFELGLVERTHSFQYGEAFPNAHDGCHTEAGFLSVLAQTRGGVIRCQARGRMDPDGARGGVDSSASDCPTPFRAGRMLPARLNGRPSAEGLGRSIACRRQS
jgi:hypothetical protein